jgi:hypothetical protein
LAYVRSCNGTAVRAFIVQLQEIFQERMTAAIGLST